MSALTLYCQWRGNRGYFVAGNWFGSGVHMQLEWRASHHGEFLVFTHFKHSAGIMVQ